MLENDAEAQENEPDVPRETEPDLAEMQTYFGDSYPAVEAFHRMLSLHGEERGLIGPRELGRLWTRHLLNSAAVVSFLPESGVIIDLGSGAGLPGIVIAAMRPAVSIILIEPMERRCAWLAEVVEELGMTNVEIKRGRAEEFHGAFQADVVTARAVAPLDRLARWSFPLIVKGGSLVALKGKNVGNEVPPALKILRKYGVTEPEIFEAKTLESVESTTVLRATRTK